jgi:hypothetical protein
MPPKSTRARKPTNRLPKSLAALPTDPPIVPEPCPAPDPEPLDLLIDLRLLDATVAVDNDIERQFSPFSDGYIKDTQPQSSLRHRHQQSSTLSDPFQPSDQVVILNNSQQPTHIQQDTKKENKLFSWTDLIVDTLLNKLLHQVELRKRANSGFKKEAWIACIEAIEDIQSQPVSLKQCKNKIDILKGQWKNFNWLRGHSGFR